MKTKINAAKVFKTAFVFLVLICLVFSSVPITFAATPKAQSVEIQDVECIYHADGFWVSDVDTDTWDRTDEYFFYYFDPTFTVTLTDGTVLESDEYGCVTYNNKEYYLDFETDQSYENQWGIGTYTVTAEILGATASFNVSVVESPVSKVEVESIEVFEHSNGYWDFDYNEKTDDYDLEYYYYDVNPDFTVTLKDGTVLESMVDSEYGFMQKFVIYNDNRYYLELNNDQSYENPWGVGKHTANAEIMGFETSFEVTINESPVSKVEIKDIDLIENADGYWETDYNYETDAYDLEYFYYEFTPEYTVTFKDGTVLDSVNGFVLFDGDYCFLNYDTEQNYYEPWEIGTYTVNAEVLGCEASFNVNISETPVKSMEFEDVECIRHTDGYWEYYYNPETEEYDPAREYFLYAPDVEEFTATLNDGTVLKSENGYVEYNGKEYGLDCYTEQSYDNQWDEGIHTATARFMGFEQEFKFTVLPSPVKSVEIGDENIIQNSNGFWDADYNPETDEWDLEYYYYYIGMPSFTVTLNDGTVLESEYGEVTYNDATYGLYFDADQSYENPWGVGTHKISAEIMGYETSFNVNITECPVKSVDIQDISIIQHTNGYWEEEYNPETDDYDLEYYYYSMNYLPYNFTVTLNDGTALESENGCVIYDGTEYELYCASDQSYQNQWGIGAHTATAEIMGAETSFNINIEPSPVKSVEIQDLKFNMYTNGYWENEYNDVTGEWDLKYYCYEVNPDFTVTLDDGTVLVSDDGCVNYKGIDYVLDFETEQDYETQWGVGTHTVEAEIMGAKSSFDVTISNEVSGYKLGDVNLDGNVNVKDATYIQRMVVEEAGLTVTDVQKQLADVNGDGTISVKDATQLQIIIVNT